MNYDSGKSRCRWARSARCQGVGSCGGVDRCGQSAVITHRPGVAACKRGRRPSSHAAWPRLGACAMRPC